MYLDMKVIHYKFNILSSLSVQTKTTIGNVSPTVKNAQLHTIKFKAATRIEDNCN